MLLWQEEDDYNEAQHEDAIVIDTPSRPIDIAHVSRPPVGAAGVSGGYSGHLSGQNSGHNSGGHNSGGHNLQRQMMSVAAHSAVAQSFYDSFAHDTSDGLSGTHEEHVADEVASVVTDDSRTDDDVHQVVFGSSRHSSINSELQSSVDSEYLESDEDGEDGLLRSGDGFDDTDGHRHAWCGSCYSGLRRCTVEQMLLWLLSLLALSLVAHACAVLFADLSFMRGAALVSAAAHVSVFVLVWCLCAHRVAERQAAFPFKAQSPAQVCACAAALLLCAGVATARIVVLPHTPTASRTADVLRRVEIGVEIVTALTVALTFSKRVRRITRVFHSVRREARRSGVPCGSGDDDALGHVALLLRDDEAPQEEEMTSPLRQRSVHSLATLSRQPFFALASHHRGPDEEEAEAVAQRSRRLSLGVVAALGVLTVGVLALVAFARDETALVLAVVAAHATALAILLSTQRELSSASPWRCFARPLRRELRRLTLLLLVAGVLQLILACVAAAQSSSLPSILFTLAEDAEETFQRAHVALCFTVLARNVAVLAISVVEPLRTTERPATLPLVEPHAACDLKDLLTSKAGVRHFAAFVQKQSESAAALLLFWIEAESWRRDVQHFDGDGVDTLYHCHRQGHRQRNRQGHRQRSSHVRSYRRRSSRSHRRRRSEWQRSLLVHAEGIFERHLGALRPELRHRAAAPSALPIATSSTRKASNVSFSFQDEFALQPGSPASPRVPLLADAGVPLFDIEKETGESPVARVVTKQHADALRSYLQELRDGAAAVSSRAFAGSQRDVLDFLRLTQLPPFLRSDDCKRLLLHAARQRRLVQRLRAQGLL